MVLSYSSSGSRLSATGNRQGPGPYTVHAPRPLHQRFADPGAACRVLAVIGVNLTRSDMPGARLV